MDRDRVGETLAARDTVGQTERQSGRQNNSWTSSTYRQLPKQTSIWYENALKLRVFCLKTWPSQSQDGTVRQAKADKADKVGETSR